MRAAALVLLVGLAGSVARAEEKKDIVAIAAGNKDFSTLVAAVKAAGLVDTLKGDGPFTVFAPTNKAFAALGEAKIKALLKDKDALKSILTYHVVKGKVMAKDALALAKAEKSATTVNGAAVKLSLKGKGSGAKLTLNGTATVTKADVTASNGVIHVIDAVIVPPKGE